MAVQSRAGAEPVAARLRRLSGIARLLDFGYPSNLWIAAVSGVTLVVAVIWRGVASGDWIAAADIGIRSALAVFLAWALCRELDPDRAAAALVAALLALGGLPLFGLPGIGACVVLLLSVRVLNRSSGLPATWPDAAVLLGLAIWVGLDGSWVYPAAAAVALLGDSLLPDGGPRRLVLALAGAAIVLTILYATGSAGPTPGSAPSLAAAIVSVLAGLLLLPTVLAASHVGALGDESGEPLLSLRVRAGQLLALAVGWAAAFEHGFAGLEALMPLWAAVLAAGLFRWLPGSGTPTAAARLHSGR